MALDLLIGGDVAQLGQRAQFVEHQRRPSAELVQIGVLQRVLELRTRGPAADADVLGGLQNSVTPGTLASCGRSRLMISSAVAARSLRGLRLIQKRPLLIDWDPPVTADAERNIGDVRVPGDDVGKRLLAIQHGGKRDVLPASEMPWT